MESSIDFVLTYLDGNDPAWQLEKNRYTPGAEADINPNRYRDWDNLRYFFRAIDRFAPWVRKVHVVTWGHIPEWLDTLHPKIHIVNHRDYLPEEWLPTFSSRCIDLNLHRIPGLSEQFVYFNDDTFLTAPVKPEFFFRDGFPCDAAVLYAQAFSLRDNVGMYFAPYVDTGLINKYFRKNKVIRANLRKWISLKYGKELLSTLTMLPYPHFVCFRNWHLPCSHLKSTYEEVWSREPEFLAKACSHRFREISDPNNYVFTYWQYATGRFVPRNPGAGKCFQIHNLKDAARAAACIAGQKYRMICLNDAITDTEKAGEIIDCVNQALDRILPEECSFEKRARQ